MVFLLPELLKIRNVSYKSDVTQKRETLWAKIVFLLPELLKMPNGSYKRYGKRCESEPPE